MLVRARPYISHDELFSAMTTSPNDGVVREFEISFARLIGADACFATHQGRDALTLALQIIGTQPGDEIVVPNFICQVVIDAILKTGAIPVLVDSSLKNFTSPAGEYQQAITIRTRAILAVHLYGLPAPMESLRKIADEHRCLLLEDCAQTISSKQGGRNVGTFGDISFFSFNYDKPLSTGIGGMLVVNTRGLVDAAQRIIANTSRAPLHLEKHILKALLLQHFLTGDQYYNEFLPITFADNVMRLLPNVGALVDQAVKSKDVEMLSSIVPKISKLKFQTKLIRRINKVFKSRVDAKPMLLNAIRAQFGMEQIKHTGLVDKKRKHIAEIYQEFLKDNNRFQLPQTADTADPVFLRYTVLSRDSVARERLIENARKNNIELDHNNWPQTISSMKYYQGKVRYKRSLEQSESMVQRIVHLPTHHYVTDAHLKKIDDVLHIS